MHMHHILRLCTHDCVNACTASRKTYQRLSSSRPACLQSCSVGRFWLSLRRFGLLLLASASPDAPLLPVVVVVVVESGSREGRGRQNKTIGFNSYSTFSVETNDQKREEHTVTETVGRSKRKHKGQNTHTKAHLRFCFFFQRVFSLQPRCPLFFRGLGVQVGNPHLFFQRVQLHSRGVRLLVVLM